MIADAMIIDAISADTPSRPASASVVTTDRPAASPDDDLLGGLTWLDRKIILQSTGVQVIPGRPAPTLAVEINRARIGGQIADSASLKAFLKDWGNSYTPVHASGAREQSARALQYLNAQHAAGHIDEMA